LLYPTWYPVVASRIHVAAAAVQLLAAAAVAAVQVAVAVVVVVVGAAFMGVWGVSGDVEPVGLLPQAPSPPAARPLCLPVGELAVSFYPRAPGNLWCTMMEPVMRTSLVPQQARVGRLPTGPCPRAKSP
jgi:hypothetical protein